MSDAGKLAAVRALHTAVYIAMVASIGVLLYAGMSGYTGVWLWVAAALLTVETVVFVGNGFTCPLTELAVRYGAEAGYCFDTFLPERVTRYTFRFFGTLTAVGFALVLVR